MEKIIMNAVEAVVTFTYETEAKFGYQYDADDYWREIAPFFLEICEFFCDEEDSDDLEQLRGIYELEEGREDALQDFLLLAPDELIFREFSGFQYGFAADQNNFSFRAVAHMAIDELPARCARLGISKEELHSRYDVAIRINDAKLLDKINGLIGDSNEFLLQKDTYEFNSGENDSFEKYYHRSGEQDFYSPSQDDIDNCDEETMQFVREKKSPFPQDMVFVKGGEFFMGRRNNLVEYKHPVMLSDYYISRYPVTFDQYDSFCKETGREKPKDEGWGRFKLPVINVSYAEAKAYCLWMTQKTGIRTDLPTEAQWEFAARGGTLSKGYKYAGSNDFDEVGWLYERESDTNYPVGQKKPNELGIYDMSGNVWEWCRDIYRDHFYLISPPVDPLCNVLDPYSPIVRFTDFFKPSLDQTEEELKAAFRVWVYKMRKRTISKNDFTMVIRGGCLALSFDDIPLITQRGHLHFLRKNRKLGFRIVMYP